MLFLEEQKHVNSGKCFKWRTGWKLCPNESQLSTTAAFQQLHWTHSRNKLCTNDPRHIWFFIIWNASAASCSHGFQVQSKDASQKVSTCCRMWTTTSGSESQARQKRWAKYAVEVAHIFQYNDLNVSVFLNKIEVDSIKVLFSKNSNSFLRILKASLDTF